MYFQLCGAGLSLSLSLKILGAGYLRGLSYFRRVRAWLLFGGVYLLMVPI